MPRFSRANYIAGTTTCWSLVSVRLHRTTRFLGGSWGMHCMCRRQRPGQYSRSDMNSRLPAPDTWSRRPCGRGGSLCGLPGEHGARWSGMGSDLSPCIGCCVRLATKCVDLYQDRLRMSWRTPSRNGTILANPFWSRWCPTARHRDRNRELEAMHRTPACGRPTEVARSAN